MYTLLLSDAMLDEGQRLWDISGIAKFFVVALTTIAVVGSSYTPQYNQDPVGWALVAIIAAIVSTGSFALDLWAETKYLDAWEFRPRAFEEAGLGIQIAPDELRHYKFLADKQARETADRNSKCTVHEMSGVDVPPGPLRLAIIVERSAELTSKVYRSLTPLIVGLLSLYFVCFLAVAVFLVFRGGASLGTRQVLGIKFILYLLASNVILDVIRTLVRLGRNKKAMNTIYARSTTLAQLTPGEAESQKQRINDLLHQYCAVESQPFPVPRRLAKRWSNEFNQMWPA